MMVASVLASQLRRFITHHFFLVLISGSVPIQVGLV